MAELERLAHIGKLNHHANLMRLYADSHALFGRALVATLVRSEAHALRLYRIANRFYDCV